MNIDFRALAHTHLLGERATRPIRPPKLGAFWRAGGESSSPAHTSARPWSPLPAYPMTAKEPLNKSARAGAPGFGMGCEAQSAAIPRGIASICNDADRPNT
ncbi:MAG: hypothetical protein LBE78_01195, partial [Burkholderiaceae bacterium]|nr:hypothetical protein [Burkholderiaceae bacterium]